MLKGLLENIIKYLGIEKTEAVTSSKAAEENTVVLDDLTTYTTNEAISYLVNNNLNYQVVGEGSQVTSSAPHTGTEVQEGSTIILYVTKAAGEDNTVQVPNVLGRSYNEAVAAIMNAGLGAVINGDENGVVVSQSPKKGETVSPGEDITLTFEVTDSGITESGGGSNTDTSSTDTSGTSNTPTVTTQKVITTTKKTGKIVK